MFAGEGLRRGSSVGAVARVAVFGLDLLQGPLVGGSGWLLALGAGVRLAMAFGRHGAGGKAAVRNVGRGAVEDTRSAKQSGSRK